MKIDFWTSTEYRGFLAGLIRELNADGGEAGPFDKLRARQRYQISEASYRAAKSPAARLFLRFRQYVAYPLQLCCCLLASRRVRVESESESGSGKGRGANGAGCADIVVVSTNTFYAPLLATYLHPNVVHLVYDLFPEAMIHSGKWDEGSLKVKLVRWMTRKTLRRARTNVFLGERLKDYVDSIHGPVPNAAIIAVGADQSLFRQSPEARLGESESECGTAKAGLLPETPLSLSTLTSHSGPRAKDPVDIALRQTQGSRESFLTILYCGNFGNLHDSATLFGYWRSRSVPLQQASTPESSPSARKAFAEAARYLFHCSGPKRAALETVHRELPDALRERIVLGGGLSQAEWVAAMESAEVALVTTAPGSETVVMPSKTYSAMMAGQAILAIAPEHSDLVDLIKTADCGWWVEPGDVEGLAEIIESICNKPAQLLAKRTKAFEHAHAHFGQDNLAKKWVKVFKLGTELGTAIGGEDSKQA